MKPQRIHLSRRKDFNQTQTTRSNMNDRIRTVIGIDPGVNTGMAATFDGILVEVYTASFTKAQADILELVNRGNALELVIEDPRGQYVPFHQREPQRIKGVGSVERDAKLWIEFAEFYGIKYRTVKPGKYRKIDAKTFKAWTGWTGRTSEHARAAAMMVFEKQRTK